jgi:hypothetical protein
MSKTVWVGGNGHMGTQLFRSPDGGVPPDGQPSQPASAHASAGLKFGAGVARPEILDPLYMSMNDFMVGRVKSASSPEQSLNIVP